jgi:desulfoferrodoxin-like iron-binding protein
MSTRSGEKYKCVVCTNEVVVAKDGTGTLVCCGKSMEMTGEGFMGETTDHKTQYHID